MGLTFEVKTLHSLLGAIYVQDIGMLLSLGAWPMHPGGVRDVLCSATTVSIDQQVAVGIQKGNSACTRTPEQAPLVDTHYCLNTIICFSYH